ncbi:MAG: response regulator transcription factor [Nocardioides sp.]|nr:response regulator transcription factor [Nocardioides sp.]
MSIGVLIADDEALVRRGFTMILDAEPDLEVVGTAAGGHEAVEAALTGAPDVVLMDIRMPGMDGIEATRQIAAAGGPPVIVVTTFGLDEYVFEALRAGASGFLLKNTPPEHLADAVRLVNRGDALVAPEVTRLLIESFVQRPGPVTTPASLRAALSTREVEVLALLARGLSNTEIAEALVISEPTAKTHVGHILAKLNLRDRAQAIVLAYESGFVVPPRAAQVSEPGSSGTSTE